MKEFTVDSFAQLHEALSRYRNDARWVFRGQQDPSWELVPKAGRRPITAKLNDRKYFEGWKKSALEHIRIMPKDTWDWLAIAQHHGLITRLLDWTSNPLAAAFFSVVSDSDSNSAIYAYHTTGSLHEEEDPFKIRGVHRFRPWGVAARIIRQFGLFTVHGPPALSLEAALEEDDALERIIIESHYRKPLRFELSHYGVNRYTLFPDLDGLSQHLNWIIENSDYWEEKVAADI